MLNPFSLHYTYDETDMVVNCSLTAWWSCGAVIQWLFCCFAHFCRLCFHRFSNLQTRSSSTGAEGEWALAAQSLPQGKLRNDTSSLPSTCDPSLLPSLPLFSFLFTKQPEIKPIPRAFFLFYLYFLKHLMLWIVWMSACAGDQRVLCRWALKSCVHVYILCESIRDLYFPLSLTTLPVERLNHSVCLYSNFDWRKQGLGDSGKIAGHEF